MVGYVCGEGLFVDRLERAQRAKIRTALSRMPFLQMQLQRSALYSFIRAMRAFVFLFL